MDVPLKSAIAGGLESLGILALAEAVTARDRKAVFTLHRVLPDPEMHDCYNPSLAITPESFDRFLGFLAEHCPVLPMAEFLAVRKTRPGPYCTLTFDDGWEDNHRFAFPILKKYKMAATIFLCTGLIGSSDSIPEEAMWRIKRNAEQAGRGKEMVKVLAEAVAQETPEGVSFSTAQKRLKQMPMAAKRLLLKELVERFGISPLPRVSLMNWEQVREMHAHGVSFGSHTMSHAILPAESRDDRSKELMESQRVLEQHVPGWERVLAYPSGGVNQEVVEGTKDAGYVAAFTTMPGYAGEDANNFLMPRIGIDNDVVNGSEKDFSRARARVHLLRRGSIGWAAEGAY